MRALVALGLLLSSSAHAGGFGLVGTVGGATETLRYYDSENDFAQYSQSQFVSNFGGGIEFIVGDRDDKILGLFRAYPMVVGPQHDPAETSSLEPGVIVAAWRDEPYTIGVGTLGLAWGVVGDPNGFQLSVMGEMGSGFLTKEHTEFFLLQGGPSVQYMVGPALQLHADLEYGLRMRKTVDHGPTAYIGARYLFD